MKFNQKLANLCQFLQSQDRNGDYDTLFQEVLNGETSLSEGMEACINGLENLQEHSDVSDWLRYARD